jgi:hypothetical protein
LESARLPSFALVLWRAGVAAFAQLGSFAEMGQAHLCRFASDFDDHDRLYRMSYFQA